MLLEKVTSNRIIIICMHITTAFYHSTESIHPFHTRSTIGNISVALNTILYVYIIATHSKKRYVRRNIRLSCVKGKTEKTIAKNIQCKNDTVFSVINRGRNSNNLGGSISARASIL